VWRVFPSPSRAAATVFIDLVLVLTCFLFNAGFIFGGPFSQVFSFAAAPHITVGLTGGEQEANHRQQRKKKLVQDCLRKWLKIDKLRMRGMMSAGSEEIQ
jgi:hypothetical protein